jgi:hypothetical protein
VRVAGRQHDEAPNVALVVVPAVQQGLTAGVDSKDADGSDGTPPLLCGLFRSASTAHVIVRRKKNTATDGVRMSLGHLSS